MEFVQENFPELAAILVVCGLVAGYFMKQIKYYRDKNKDQETYYKDLIKQYQDTIKEKDNYLKVRNERLADLYTKAEKCMMEMTMTMQQLSKDTEKSDGGVAEFMGRVFNEISEIKQAIVLLTNERYGNK